MAVAALDGLLLDQGQINSVLTAGMRVRNRTQAMWDSSATFSDKSCLALDGPAQEAVYADTGWTAMRGQQLDDNYDDPTVRNDSAAEAVIAYPTARQANTFYDASVRRWFACANRKFVDRPRASPRSCGPRATPTKSAAHSARRQLRTAATAGRASGR